MTASKIIVLAKRSPAAAFGSRRARHAEVVTLGLCPEGQAGAVPASTRQVNAVISIPVDGQVLRTFAHERAGRWLDERSAFLKLLSQRFSNRPTYMPLRRALRPLRRAVMNKKALSDWHSEVIVWLLIARINEI